jgi:hypothetical protein
MSQHTSFAQGKHIHSMVEKDIESMTGVCSRCGVVPLQAYKRGKKTYYKCWKAHKEHERTQNQRRLGTNTHGLGTSEAQEFISDKVCNVCLSEFDLCVDHNHQTQKLRGVLCRTHNLGLSFFGDDPEMLRRAADYLEGQLAVARSSNHTGDRFYGEARSATRRGRRASLL